MSNFVKKHTIPALIIIAITAIAAILAGCFSNWTDDAATITINLGAANSRGAADIDRDSATLEHTITLSGSGKTQAFTFEKGVKTANITVAPGRYTITVEAYYVVPPEYYYGIDAGVKVKLAYSDPKSINVIAGKNNPVTIEMKWVKSVTGVTLESPLALAVGETAPLIADVLPPEATNKKVTWESDDPDIATVSSTGLVTGVSQGTAWITVRTEDGGYTNSCEVTVTDDPTYGITLASSGNPLTGTYTFTAATVGYAGQTPLTVTVTNNGNQPTGNLAVSFGGNTNFTSSPTTINSITNTNGTATFAVAPNADLAVGTYTATVTVTGTNSISASFNVSFTVIDSEEVVDIDNMTDVGDIQTAIEVGLASGDVKVIGEKTNANATLSLTIPAGKTVTWEAVYSGTVGAPLINVYGTGRFIVKGTVNNTNGSNAAISCDSGATIIVDGGTITAGGNAIQVMGAAKVVIQGDSTVTSNNSIAINVSGNASVAILGGTISTSNDGYSAVRIADDSIVYMAGGNILANSTPVEGGITRTSSGTGYYAGGYLTMFCQAHTNPSIIFTFGTDLFLYTEQVDPWW